MTDENQQNEPEVVETTVTGEQAARFIEHHMNIIQSTLPDFTFTLVGRNTAHPGQDLILTIDSPLLVIKALEEAVRRHAARTQGGVIVQ